MSKLILTISGSSGGDRGPQGIYRLFPGYLNDHSVTVLSVDTIPDSVQENVVKVIQIAQERINLYDRIYLVGYSMGGAVAVQVAHHLIKTTGTDRVAGIVLLSTQTDGLQPLKELDIPVLFYCGSEDEYFPLWQIKPHSENYKGQKRFVQVDHLKHDLSPINYSYISSRYINSLAKDVTDEMNSFFNNKKKNEEKWNVDKLIPISRLDRFINLFYSVRNKPRQ